MSQETKNNALLKSLAVGMLLAGPIALTGCATNYDDTSSATAAQKASGEAEAGKAEAEGSSYSSATKYGSGEAEAESEGASYSTGSAEGEAESEAEAETLPPVNCPAGTTPQPNGTCLQG